MNGQNVNETDSHKTIDEAIRACETIISRHTIHARLMLAIIGVVTWGLYEAFKYLEKISEQVTAVAGGLLDPKSIEAFLTKCSVYPFVLFGLFLTVFGISIALYRFHMTEISRNEQIKLGFWRIRIAARNTSEGFQTEVRQALTKDAFSFSQPNSKGKNKEIESPVPGHPASDIAATLLNKIIENLDVTVNKKQK